MKSYNWCADVRRVTEGDYVQFTVPFSLEIQKGTVTSVWGIYYNIEYFNDFGRLANTQVKLDAIVLVRIESKQVFA